MKAYQANFSIYQCIEDPLMYVQVVTYANDGHFYYKRYPKGYETDYKLRKITKQKLLDILQEYQLLKPCY